MGSHGSIGAKELSASGIVSEERSHELGLDGFRRSQTAKNIHVRFSGQYLFLRRWFLQKAKKQRGKKEKTKTHMIKVEKHSEKKEENTQHIAT